MNPQSKVPMASSSGSLGFIVCVQCCRMVDSVPITNLFDYSSMNVENNEIGAFKEIEVRGGPPLFRDNLNSFFIQPSVTWSKLNTYLLCLLLFFRQKQ